MRFESDLQSGLLVRRYKRFLADVELADGKTLTVHCPNTGAMTGCSTPGSKVWFSTSPNPKRKYPNTLEIIEPIEGVAEGVRIGINSGKANALVAEAIEGGVIRELSNLQALRREVTVPDEAGRFDFGFVDSEGVAGYVEVKSVTLSAGGNVGAFPDAVSERALRHVKALQRRVAEGERGVLLFCVQHTGIEKVRCAHEVYPEYAEEVNNAAQAGVEVLAYGCDIPDEEGTAERVDVERVVREIRVVKPLPVLLGR